MGATAGIALKSLQWFLRGVQFLCAGLVLGIYSYFLATLAANNVQSATWVRAVEGISGLAALYSGLALLLLCCLAGRKFVSFLVIALDAAFACSFIYVAVQNRAGAASCDGGVGETPFGSSSSSSATVTSSGGPTFFTACKLQSACLAVSIVAIFFFIFSAANEVFIARHRHKENRFGPGPQNDYTSGYGKRKGGILGFLSRSGTVKSRYNDENMLPQHATPADMREPVTAAGDDGRVSYNTEATAVAADGRLSYSPNNGGDSLGYRNKYGDVPPADDGLAMNPPQPIGAVSTRVAINNNPYDTGVNGSFHSAFYDSNANVNSAPAAAGPYPGSFSRPRTADNRQQQLPRNYKYSDGVYDA